MTVFDRIRSCLFLVLVSILTSSVAAQSPNKLSDVAMSDLSLTPASAAPIADAVGGTGGPMIGMRFVKRNPACVGGGNAGALCVSDCDCDSGLCGGDIPYTQEMVVNPGGAVVVEFIAAGWDVSGYRVRGVEFEVKTLASFHNSESGALSIHTGEKCCLVDAQCVLADGPCSNGTCQPSGAWHPELYGGLFVDVFRPDYVFFGLDTVGPFDDVSIVETSFRIGNILLSSSDAVAYSPPAKYLGTMVLDVSPDARGTFVFQFGELTFLQSDAPDHAHIPNLTVAPVTLTVRAPTCGNGECEPGEDELSCPTDCAPSYCGDGNCDPDESSANCPADCATDDIPAASQWGLIALGLCLLAIAKITFSRRRALGA